MSVLAPVIDSYNGETRRLYLKQGIERFHWIEDIYREYINKRAIDESFQKWAPLMKASGNEPKGGGKFTPRYVTLLEGTRIVPYDENILIEVTGEAITDNADVDPDPFDTSTRTQPLKLYITPPAAELVLGGGADPAAIAIAVWQKILEGGLTAEEIMKVMGAVLAGTVSGAGSGIETFKGLDKTTDRVVSTVDADGNRSSVILNVS